jgi:phenylpropionate dioxygenase-like ring-hydroxylating dioxygenase large terminal subunit
MASSYSNSIGLSDAQVAAVRAPLANAALLPASVYNDPEVFKLERERIFGRTWMPVCHISQLRESGDYVQRDLVGESVLAIRDRSGDIRVMSNVCRHRNMALTTGSGQCKGRIMCPYHGWTYGLDGRLLAAPFMDQTADFNRSEISLPQFRHEIWHGFVFVNFDDNAIPLSEELAEFEPWIGPYRFEDMEIFEMRRATMPWNWKISLENFSEAYHQPWVHTHTAEQGFPAALAEYWDTNSNYSIFTLRREDSGVLETFTPAVEGLSDKHMRHVSVFNVYPYLHALVDPGTPLVLDFNIKNENEHELVWSVLMPKGSRENPEIADHVKAFEGFIVPVLHEDIDICTGVGRGVNSRFTAQGRLSHMEKSLHQFHNWWLDKMLADDLAIAAE